MTDTAATKPNDRPTKGTAGWYVLLLAWIAYAGLFYAFARTVVKDAPDVTNYQMLDLAHKYSAFAGVAMGLAAFLATGIVYLIARAVLPGARRMSALVLTALGYGVWLVFGYDLVYKEPRYAEIARAIITYLGKPTYYAAAVVCGAALLGAALTLVFRKRSR